MTKPELLAVLKRAAAADDQETAHIDADNALLEFIDDDEISAAYSNVPRWYA